MDDVKMPSYTANAQAAAATAVGDYGPQNESGCPACVKAGLPILLVRPGLATAEYAATVAGAIAPLLKGTADSVPLTASGYAIRSLREGYVYAYYDTPHTPQLKVQQGWQVQRVSPGGYLTPYPINSLPVPGSQADQAFACDRAASYATAMLFVIPDAQRTGNVWIGYSDHPWSEEVRQAYARDMGLRDKRMTRLHANAAVCRRSVTLTVDYLNANHLDYARPSTAYDALLGNPYPVLRGRREAPEQLLDQAEWIVEQPGGAGFSIDDALIVAVPDPIGVTAEAAERRLALTQGAAQWLAQQERSAWKLRSALSIDGLLKKIDAGGARRFKDTAGFHDQDMRLVTRAEFEQRQQDGTLPPEAGFEPNPRLGMNPRPPGGAPTDDGRLRIPGKTRIQRDTTALRQAITDNLKPGWRLFLETYQQKVAADAKLRQKLDADYVAWLDSALRRLVTTHDYDSADPHDGMAYAAAVCRITRHGPLTGVSAKSYARLLTADPHDPDNLLVRAALGNQVAFFAWLSQPGPRGSLYGLIKTLFDLDSVTDTLGSRAGLAKVVAAAYASPLLATIGATAATLDKAGQLTPALRDTVRRLAGALMGTARDAPPALLKLRAPLSVIAEGWRAQLGEIGLLAHHLDGHLQSQVLRGAIALEGLGQQPLADTLVDVYVWTRELPKNVGKVLDNAQAAAGLYVLEPAATNLAEHWRGARVALDIEGVEQLFRHAGAVLKSGDAILSVGAGVLNLMVLSAAAHQLETLQGAAREQALFTLASAGLGVVGAAAESYGFAQRAVAKSAALEGAEAVGTRAIAAGGVLGALGTAVAAYQTALAAYGNYNESDSDAANFQVAQSFFLITGSFALGAAALPGTADIALLGFSLTGWGLLLVALGFAAGYIASLLEDGPTAEWAARCIWGTGSDRYASPKKEQLTLNKIFVGVRIEFGFTPNRWHNAVERLETTLIGPVTRIAAAVDSTGDATQPEQQADTTRDAVLRLFFPAADTLPWAYQIIGMPRDGQPVVLASHAHEIEISEPAQRHPQGARVTPMTHENDTLQQRVTLDDQRFWAVKAVVIIYRDRNATVPLVEETLTAT